MDYEEMILEMQEARYDGYYGDWNEEEEEHYNPVIMRMLAERGN